jgi:5-formyltetrahydrofolate cyclo-ligase
MSAEPAGTKAEIRRRLQDELRKLSPEDRVSRSTDLCAILRSQPVWNSARSVLLFVPTRDEPDISALIPEAIAAGKSVALPRHLAEADHYAACRVMDPRRDLVPGRFGIPEPLPGCPIVPPNELDFALVPGIGFALDGGRLGRGRGYFDRLLAAVPGFKCGAAFDCQIASDLLLEPHDISLDCILTPTRWHPTGRRSRS